MFQIGAFSDVKNVQEKLGQVLSRCLSINKVEMLNVWLAVVPVVVVVVIVVVVVVVVFVAVVVVTINTSCCY